MDSTSTLRIWLHPSSCSQLLLLGPISAQLHRQHYITAGGQGVRRKVSERWAAHVDQRTSWQWSISAIAHS
jgi:hypothetical protein